MIRTIALLTFAASACLAWAASPVCNSIFVFKTPVACAAGDDKTEPAEITLDGGFTHEEVGNRIIDKYNSDHASGGKKAVSAQYYSEHRNKDLLSGHVTYDYTYIVTLETCGLSDQYRYVDASHEAAVPRGAQCLSCDQFAHKSARDLATCLKFSVSEIINKKAVDLRPEDLKAVLAQVTNLQDIIAFNSTPIEAETARLFIEFKRSQNAQEQPAQEPAQEPMQVPAQ